MPILDLTLPLADGMAVYPGDPAVSIRPAHTLASHGWRVQAISLGSHAGTHVNAPWHMAANGTRLEHLPLERLCGPAVVRGHGPVPPGVGLIYADFPLLLEEARLLAAAGTPFVAQAATWPLDEAAERLLCELGLPSFENLANTELLPRGEAFFFMGLPLAVPGDGAPVRAVAMIGELAPPAPGVEQDL